MKRAKIAGWAGAAVLVLLAVVAGYRALDRDVPAAAATPPATTPSTAPAAAQTHPAAATDQGFLYGRVVTADGTVYEGRLRFGIDQEAFWGDYFNGYKPENPWRAHLPPERLKERYAIEILGIEIARRERQVNLGRPFTARFGELARIEARGRDVRVTLKSGTVFDLDRYGASDLDDGLRVWDGRRGAVDLTATVQKELLGIEGDRRIRTIELLPTPPLGAAPYRLQGTVRTRQGDFTGFVAWHRHGAIGPDELDGRTAAAEGEGEDELSLRFDTIRSIARRSRDSSLVTLLDGREIVLSGTPEVGAGNRGIYVDDPRYGRVQIFWDTFERADFGPGGSGPAYGDFPPGRRLTGSVTTRAGRRLAGRLVYDLDETETTDTLDAQNRGVHYTIPFGLIASIAPGGRVTLHGGEELQLERTGDLGEANLGMLIYIDGGERPVYVPWTDVEQVDIDRPPVVNPPLGGG